jgi:aspartokinase
MVTISQLTKKYVDETPFLREALSKKLLNYGAVAAVLKPRIEKNLGKHVKNYAIIMALRRYADSIGSKHEGTKIMKVFERGSELNMKSGLCDITVSKSRTLAEKIRKLYSAIDFEKGDILNIVHGNLTVTIIVNEKYKERTLNILSREKIIHIEDDLTQVSVKFPHEFLYTPGVLYQMTREFLWHNINLIEIVSSLTELNFMIKRKDAVRSYSILEDLLVSSKKAKK